MKITIFNQLFCVMLFVLNSTSIAAPLKTKSSLPLSGNDLAQARITLKTDAAVEQFTYFIKDLEVFPDHQNPTEIEKIEDRSITKAFYIAPFFQAPEERFAVGTQEISEQALTLIAEVTDGNGFIDPWA